MRQSATERAMEARAIWAVLMSLFCHNGVNFRKGSLRASSPFGGYREQYMRERHARGDATAGGGLSRLRRSLARSRAARFASPNRRVCSQATGKAAELKLKKPSKLL